MADPKNPKPGDLSVDVSDIAVVDVTPDEVRGFTRIRSGQEEAVACLARLSAADAQTLGLNAADLTALAGLATALARVNQVQPAVKKLAELIEETRLYRGHKINQALGEMANQARRRAERDPKAEQLLGAIQPLSDYQFGPAERGAAARARNRPADPDK